MNIGSQAPKKEVLPNSFTEFRYTNAGEKGFYCASSSQRYRRVIMRNKNKILPPTIIIIAMVGKKFIFLVRDGTTCLLISIPGKGRQYELD